MNHKEQYLGRHVEFVSSLDEFGMEPGCRAVITGISPKDQDNCIKIEFDWSIYAEYNKLRYSPNWRDSSNDKFTLKFHETKFYPKDHKDTWYFDAADDLTQYFKVINVKEANEELLKCLAFATENNLTLAAQEIQSRIFKEESK